jgi:hypothetical protein
MLEILMSSKKGFSKESGFYSRSGCRRHRFLPLLQFCRWQQQKVSCHRGFAEPQIIPYPMSCSTRGFLQNPILSGKNDWEPKDTLNRLFEKSPYQRSLSPSAIAHFPLNRFL